MIYFVKHKYLTLFENKTLDKIFVLEKVINRINSLSRYIRLEQTKKEMQENAMKLMFAGEKKAYLCLMFDIEKACRVEKDKNVV